MKILNEQQVCLAYNMVNLFPYLTKCYEIFHKYVTAVEIITNIKELCINKLTVSRNWCYY